MNRSDEREKAIQQGLKFMYEAARDPKNFKAHGSDYLSCFSLIASRSCDPRLRRMARGMGRELARQWRSDNPALPLRAEPKTIAVFIDATMSADLLGVRDGELKDNIRKAGQRFTAEDFLGFDPAIEPPPPDIPQRCRCGTRNLRGRKTCRVCKRRLLMRSRYQVWMKALYRGYRGDRSGVRLGTKYADALAWLPVMRPYCGPGQGNDEDFYYSVYAVTHVVYTLNDYGRFRLLPRWLPCEFEFLCAHLDAVIEMDDTDMVGEFLDTLKAFGLSDTQRLIRRGTEYLLSRQNSDGSWGDLDFEDACTRYHPTWTAVDGLRDYAWRGERLSFPKLKPLLELWARERIARPKIGDSSGQGTK